VGEVVEIDEITEKRDTLKFARLRVKIPVNYVVSMVKDFCINDILCKVSFEEEGSTPNISFKKLFGKWDGGGSDVDTEASSEEGSLGASLCDSVGSKFDVAEGGRVTVDGGGRVEATGGGRAGNGGPVQGKMDSTPLRKAC